jgi:hypothetical protein
VKDPDKVLVPNSNLILIAFREDKTEDYIPFTSLADLPPHLGHGSETDTSVSGSLVVRTAGLAHMVRSPIASRTAWVSPSNCFPLNLRWST